ncbi:MAG: hypothetical protein JOZ63_00825, partial [Planctomycetaceae bacterium]|nr:hypothetical protein [Planctomycetaceae bacterium]
MSIPHFVIKAVRSAAAAAHDRTEAPECMPMEPLWNDWRKFVTHNHDRHHIDELDRDCDTNIEERAQDPVDVWRTISRQFAERQQNRRNEWISLRISEVMAAIG